MATDASSASGSFEAATSAAYAAPRRAVFEMWEDLNREDIGVLERLQQGRLSPAYDGGRLSPHWEGPTHEFGRLVIEKILAPSPRPCPMRPR